MTSRLFATFLLGLMLLGINSAPGSRLVQNDKPPDCRNRLRDWASEEDLGIRIYYSPPEESWHPPIIFLPMSPLDQRLGDLDREVIGVTPTEMRALAGKLAETNLEWERFDHPVALFPGSMNLPWERASSNAVPDKLW